MGTPSTFSNRGTCDWDSLGLLATMSIRSHSVEIHQSERGMRVADLLLFQPTPVLLLALHDRLRRGRRLAEALAQDRHPGADREVPIPRAERRVETVRGQRGEPLEELTVTPVESEYKDVLLPPSHDGTVYPRSTVPLRRCGITSVSLRSSGTGEAFSSGACERPGEHRARDHQPITAFGNPMLAGPAPAWPDRVPQGPWRAAGLRPSGSAPDQSICGPRPGRGDRTRVRDDARLSAPRPMLTARIDLGRRCDQGGMVTGTHDVDTALGATRQQLARD